MTELAPTQCSCVFHHWVTEEQRQQISASMMYARQVGDMDGSMLGLLRLTQHCPARTRKPINDTEETSNAKEI